MFNKITGDLLKDEKWNNSCNILDEFQNKAFCSKENICEVEKK